MNKKILITGASSGFGKAMAERFAADGDHVIITGRRGERLMQLSEELTAKYAVQVDVLVFDVQDRNAVFENLANNPLLKNIDVLVNNAGLALGRDLFEDASLDDWETMLDTNVKGVMYVTKAVLPFFIEQKKGHIINISSIAGVEVYERGNGYCASKHAVTALSESMRIDLMKHNIKVTAIHPGAAETEFSLVRFKGDPEKANAIYNGYTPLSGEDIADTVFYCAGLPPHVCLNSIVMTCTAQPNSFYLNRG